MVEADRLLATVPPSAGQVLLFGEDVTRLPAHERVRRGLRRTYQTSLLFRELTVRDNLFLAVRGVMPGRLSLLRPSAADAGRHAVEALLAHGRLDAIAGTLVGNLSHGQQRQLGWHVAEQRTGHQPRALRQGERERDPDNHRRYGERAERTQQQRHHPPARGAQRAQQRDFLGLASRIALRRQGDRHAGQ